MVYFINALEKAYLQIKQFCQSLRTTTLLTYKDINFGYIHEHIFILNSKISLFFCAFTDSYIQNTLMTKNIQTFEKTK